jgi:hypothetical protein
MVKECPGTEHLTPFFHVQDEHADIIINMPSSSDFQALAEVLCYTKN